MLAVGGHLVRGRIDASYERDGRTELVDFKTGRRFGFRVLNATSYAVHLGGLHVRRSGGLLVLRAPKPGHYVLRVNANGHVARAIVVITP